MTPSDLDTRFYLDTPSALEYPQLLALWENSVRATHHFLKKADIEYFKPRILNEYFDAVALKTIRTHKGDILGFMGTAEQNLEMLFIHSSYIGKGAGTRLLKHAIETIGIKYVDVNEGNENALAFYIKHGFEVTGRSEKDGTGKPYPILHLTLA